MDTITARIPLPSTRSALDEAIDEFAAAAVRAQSLDPVTTELVRLRCAQYHDCRKCSSLRWDAALSAGVGADVMGTLEQYETSSLDDRAKAALRFTDAMIIWPRDIDQNLVASLREHFTDAEIVELAVDIVKWSHQKVQVALRLDEPTWEGIAVLSWDEKGDPVIGGPADQDGP